MFLLTFSISQYLIGFIFLSNNVLLSHTSFSTGSSGLSGITQSDGTKCRFINKGHSWQGLLDTTLCDKVCQWLTTGRWFSPVTPVSSTNKTDHHDLTEILLKVKLSIINLTTSNKDHNSSEIAFIGRRLEKLEHIWHTIHPIRLYRTYLTTAWNRETLSQYVVSSKPCHEWPLLINLQSSKWCSH
jgi:hypothetical protein